MANGRRIALNCSSALQVALVEDNWNLYFNRSKNVSIFGGELRRDIPVPCILCLDGRNGFVVVIPLW